MPRFLINLLWLLLAVVVMVGGGCAFRFGGQQFNDPRGDGKSRTRLRIEGELSSPPVLGGYLEGTAAIGWVRLESSDQTLTVYDYDEADYDRVPVSQTDIADVRIGGRLYPFASLDTDWFGTGVRIEPYVTGGGGYYWATSTKREAGDELCCGEYELEEDRDAVAQGLFPYLGFGVKARFDDNWSAFLEVREDFDRIDGGRDTGGTSVMLGIRWGF